MLLLVPSRATMCGRYSTLTSLLSAAHRMTHNAHIKVEHNSAMVSLRDRYRADCQSRKLKHEHSFSSITW